MSRVCNLCYRTILHCKTEHNSDTYLKTYTVATRIQRLRSRIADMTASRDLSLDTETTTDIQSIIVEEESRALRGLPQDSFQRIFWQQQKAAAMVDKRGMRWHPAMIKWCLFLRHQSSKAYETLRKSGCIQLPSQRTLRDYSHGVESDVGFSAGVDHQLMQTVGMPACQDWEKLVILLLDEIYIREDLVFDKHSGRLIGYASLGDVNDHLLAFEHAVEAGAEKDVIAKTMMVFMVRGLFSPLRFAYAQFPCATVTGDLLYDSRGWVLRYAIVDYNNNCMCVHFVLFPLQVMGATFDGASVNRRLVKIHNPDAQLVHKVPNIYAGDGRELFFFSDPPHLIKTVRNCWFSKARSLTVC